MLHNFKKSSNQLTLAINSNDNSYGFGYRENNNDESDHFFIKKFDNDLCNNLVVDFDKFISKENLKRVNRIKVSLGPANFNASRLIVVLARTISQQINCPLEGVSSFQLMAKRFALKNSLFPNIKSLFLGGISIGLTTSTNDSSFSKSAYFNLSLFDSSNDL